MNRFALRHTLAVVACIATIALASEARAQARTATSPLPTVASWLAYDAPPGEESRITDAIIAADNHWRRDDLGNLIMTVGTGHPRRLVACGLDHTGFIVSAITDDGYIRLHRAGTAPTHPLWDQFFQGQQVRLLTMRGGSLPGVVAIDNAHFAAEHRADTAVVNVDQLWVDVGARSRQEVADLGVALIDPVVRDLPPWMYVGHVAGADASGRAGCAAVAAVAHAAGRGGVSSGQTVFVLSALSSFSWRGLEGAVARLGTVRRCNGHHSGEPRARGDRPRVACDARAACAWHAEHIHRFHNAHRGACAFRGLAGRKRERERSRFADRRCANGGRNATRDDALVATSRAAKHVGCGCQRHAIGSRGYPHTSRRAARGS